MKVLVERNSIVINKHEIRVRYQETDQMGVVYHSNYFVWFEIGRTELLRSLGYNYRQLEEEGVYLPVINCEASYKSSAKYDDELVIESNIVEITGAKIIFEYKIYKKDNQDILAQGKTTHAFINKVGRVINIKKINPKLYLSLDKIINL